MTKLEHIRNEANKTDLLVKYGFKGPNKGDDGHNSYVKSKDDMILTDISGNEWHHMVNSVVKVVGNLSDKSLEKFLEKHYGRQKK